jgi:hypothetical protein
MEVRASALILLLLVVGAVGLTAVAPEAVVPQQGFSRLSQLEDGFAQDPTDVHTASLLAATYVELRRPALAIALIRSVGSRSLEDPHLTHQLARAYEATGRIPDALGTANLAFARCARAIGSSDTPNVTRVPEHSCSEQALASLERHRNALGHMNAWGVQDARDPRTALAYQVAERRVSLASFSEP